MGDAQFRLVALDIDGTVLNSNGEVTQELKSCLAELEAQSIRTVLCTGRRWRNSVLVAHELESAHPVVVCCGGALIKRADDESTLYVDPMPEEFARLVVGLYREAGLVPLLLYDEPLSGRELRIGQQDHDRALGLPYIQANAGCYDWYGGDYPGDGELPLEVYTMDGEARIRAGEGRVRAGVGRQGIVEAMYQTRYGPDQLAVEVHCASTTKWNALSWLLAEWGVGPDEVVAVGDDVNDIVMLRRAGLSFAMGNATAEVKAAADHVTGTNDEHGVVLALQRAFRL